MKKIVLVGASCRVTGFARALIDVYAAQYQLVGMFDVDHHKMEGFNDFIGISIPLYDDFDLMLKETQPDAAIITTVDVFHAEYVIRTLNAGVNCICEKPLCINADQCKAILAAVAANPGCFAITTHNDRYTPQNFQVKQLLKSGIIGEIRSIDFLEFLDRRHGASYFRRWNRCKKNCGGLLIHKASHHFDLLNWYTGEKPQQVMAQGGLLSYGANGSSFRGKRCPGCVHAGECAYFMDYSNLPVYHELFYVHQQPGDYTPDQCVFDPEIDIEDQATVAIKYPSGVRVGYLLNAHSSTEGQNIFIEGSTGKLEITSRHATSADVINLENFRATITLHRMDGTREELPVTAGTGGHGGADDAMFADIFGSPDFEKSWKRNSLATLADGIQAVLIGASANLSIAGGGVIDVQKLLQ